MMGLDWGSVPGWGMGLGMLIWIVVLAVVIGLVVRVANGTQYRGQEPPGQSPQEILSRRFAAGDIDADEYERRLAVLRR